MFGMHPRTDAPTSRTIAEPPRQEGASPRARGRLCAADGCDREAHTAGYCVAHYARLRKHGDLMLDVPIAPRRGLRPAGTCSVEGCDRRAAVKGRCLAHHMRLERTGSVHAGIPILGHGEKFVLTEKTPAETSFWEKVDRGDDDECWPWRGACTGFGHGRMRIDNVEVFAHRFSYKLHFGEIPTAKMVRHRCDNPPCCNPRHLVLGTRIDNARDAVERGRTCRGERHPSAKLTAEDVREIRRLYESGNTSHARLAARYGVSPGAVGAVVRRECWAHI